MFVYSSKASWVGKLLDLIPIFFPASRTFSSSIFSQTIETVLINSNASFSGVGTNYFRIGKVAWEGELYSPREGKWSFLNANCFIQIGNFLFAVSDPPEIEVERSWVHSGEGFEAQLVCIVHADPSADVSILIPFGSFYIFRWNASKCLAHWKTAYSVICQTNNIIMKITMSG